MGCLVSMGGTERARSTNGFTGLVTAQTACLLVAHSRISFDSGRCLELLQLRLYAGSPYAVLTLCGEDSA